MIDRTLLEAEKADAIRQRDEAQAKFAAAQQAMNQAQQDVIGYSYAAKQCDALLEKLAKVGLPAVVSESDKT